MMIAEKPMNQRINRLTFWMLVMFCVLLYSMVDTKKQTRAAVTPCANQR